MTERGKPDLSTIDPLLPAPDADLEEAERDAADRVGRVSSAVTGAPPAVGLEAEAEMKERSAQAETASETEERLDELRRD